MLVSDLDLECKLWIKVRLAPMAPHIGTIALAFVGPPNIKVQLLPYNHVRLMRIPVLQVRVLSLVCGKSGLRAGPTELFLQSRRGRTEPEVPRPLQMKERLLAAINSTALGMGTKLLSTH